MRQRTLGTGLTVPFLVVYLHTVRAARHGRTQSR